MKRTLDTKIDDLIDQHLDKIFESVTNRFFQAFGDALAEKKSKPRKAAPADSDNQPPAKLYKYIGWAAVDFSDVIDGVIRKRTIRFKSASLFNDPFELNPSMKQLLDPRYAEKYLNRKEIKQFLLKAFLSKWWRKPHGLLLVPLAPWLAGRYHRRMPRQIEKLEKAYAEVAAGPHGPPFKMKFACFSEDALQPLMWAHYGSGHATIGLSPVLWTVS